MYLVTFLGFPEMTAMKAASFIKKNIHYGSVLITIALSAMLLLAYLAVYINPNTFWYFAFFGLAAPFLVIGNLVVMFLWIIRWKPWAFVPLFTLLLGAGFISPMFGLPFGKNMLDAETGKSGTLKLLTYNVHMFNRPGTSKSTVREILQFIREEKPDIVCFQEFSVDSRFPLDSITTGLESLPYYALAYNYTSKNRQMGLAVFSKFNILRSDHIFYEKSTNLSMWADLLIEEDTVRVFNNHLQTTNINAKDRALFQVENIRNNPAVEESVKFIAKKLRNNYRRRAFQADTLARIIEATQYAVLVCGDFNDTPMSYTYRRVRGGLKDGFAENGRGYAHTYRGFLNLLRIDYIFYSPRFESVEYRSPSVPWSDHNPVVMRLKRP